jgi:hypothetical protein
MQRAIIVDLDGTLCNSQRVTGFEDQFGHVNWEAWGESNAYATRNEWCAEIVHGYAN